MCYGFLCVGIYKELYYMMDDGKNPPRVVLAPVEKMKKSFQSDSFHLSIHLYIQQI